MKQQAAFTVASEHGVKAEIDPHWAWAAYEPDDKRPWTLRWVGHLYRRAGFGADWRQCQQALTEGPQRTIDRLLQPEGNAEAFEAEYDGYESAAAGGDSAVPLRAWWLRRMIETPYPLQEKMTLFWHSRMGISNARVKSGRLMASHVKRLRTFSLGNYEDLLIQMAEDPAVFLGLDAERNRKARPSEHLARQLLDGYGVGPDKYSDDDVRDVARAFTGWTVLRNQLRFFEREHDDGEKTILGKRGYWDAQDAVRIIARHPETSVSIARTLYRWLVSEMHDPDAALLAPLAQASQAGTNVGRMVETILRSNLFFSTMAYRQRVKSPVEYAVGILRGLEARIATARLGEDLARLGQDLYHPPTIRGWAGGPNWINTATMVGRENLANALFSAKGPYGDKLDVAAVARRYGCSGREAGAKFVLDLLLQGDIQNSPRAQASSDESGDADQSLARQMREIAQQVVSCPEFQLG